MKSAYEIAMGRLEKQAPSLSLTAEQKKQLAEVDSQTEAKIAERRLLLEAEIAKHANDPAEQDRIRRELASEIARIEEQREARKDKIRNS